MEHVGIQREDERRGGLIPSVLLHLLFFAALLFWPVIAVPPTAAEDSVNVELVPQPQEQAENAVKPNERAGRVPKPTPKPDDQKPQAAAEQKPAPSDQTEGEQTAKPADESKTKTNETAAQDPEAQDKTPTPDQKAAMADAQPDMKADQSSPSQAQQPAEAASRQDATPPPATPDPQAQQETAAAQPSADGKMGQATATPSADPQQQPAADQAAKDSAAAQADASKAAAEPAAGAQPQQQVQSDQAVPQQAEAIPAQSDATSSGGDPKSHDPASAPKPQELATDQPSDTKVDEPDTPMADAVGTQTTEKAAPIPGPKTDQTAATPSAADPGPKEQQNAPTGQTSADAKVAQQITVPTTGGAQPQATGNQQASSGADGQVSGTAFVAEPEPRPQQQAASGGNEQQADQKPTQKDEKPAGQKGQFIQAKRFYSGAEMVRMSKDELDAWKKLPRRERVRQLCNSEENLQFRYEMKAIGYANSALAPAMISDAGLYGDGVAVRTPKGWQRVAFKCDVDDDALKVSAFSYLTTGRIPPSQLDRLGFPGN